MIRENMERLVDKYLKEIVRYQKELAGTDLSRIGKPKKTAEKIGIRNAKLLALLEVQEIIAQMIKELNVPEDSELY